MNVFLGLEKRIRNFLRGLELEMECRGGGGGEGYFLDRERFIFE